MTEDWRYSDERMDVRTQGLNVLLKSLDRKSALMDLLDIPIKASMSVCMIGYHKAT